ncbi:saccharopine dehydrogenase NADP-binding domain-containing protein [Nocardioides sp. REDSEA-S30_B4]|uniref:saccharopine dehydrogenase family protein n=1 Tax=Nocardioides sp. REDSEA-S30_B4 TaxID=1811552 RepID=UPI000A5F74C5|nr:saccharopine dehydrogenase NADP-binding domain-containing protein [Nocardioides sp. REDSEA-S30_B4]
MDKIVIFGATGFTGTLTAVYLGTHLPEGGTWAVAGRSAAKLQNVVDEVEAAGGTAPEIVLADVSDAASMRAMAEGTRVLISTVGRYVQHGDPAVRAAAEAGIAYVDLTGEPEFVDTMYVRHHAAAERSGARIVHACGFDSIPHDLGAYFTVQQLHAAGPVTLRGVVRAAGTFSGGTFHSALGAFERSRQMSQAFKERRRVEPRPEGRKSRAVAGKPGKDPVLGYYLLPMPTIDPQVVARSGAALDAYGSDFRYSHFAGTKTLRYAAGGALGVGLIGVAATIPPARNLLKSKVKQGEGPSASRREKSWFTVDFVGEGDGRTVHTRVSGGDPGYTETAKMLAESALCLAFDDNPAVAGQVTTAQAMGDNLLARLQAAGMSFEVVD